jgi:hypothetical protein
VCSPNVFARHAEHLGFDREDGLVRFRILTNVGTVPVQPLVLQQQDDIAVAILKLYKLCRQQTCLQTGSDSSTKTRTLTLPLRQTVDLICSTPNITRLLSLQGTVEYRVVVHIYYGILRGTSEEAWRHAEANGALVVTEMCVDAHSVRDRRQVTHIGRIGCRRGY